MKALFECIPCILRQSLDIARMRGLSDKKKTALVREVMQVFGAVTDLRTMTPPELTGMVHKRIKQLIGTNDLYAAAKKKENALAIRLLPWARKEIARGKDPLLTAVKLAIAGNIIDYGTASFFDLEGALRALEHQRISIDHYAPFKKVLRSPRRILYITDNAGEIAFDTLLVNELLRQGHTVTCAVKSDFALNDATLKDAKVCGMTALVPVIESGSTTAGTVLREGTPQFLKLFMDADVIIAKGQGNFETLPADDPRIFFLLKMKCVYLGKMLGLNLGDILLVRGSKKLQRILQ